MPDGLERDEWTCTGRGTVLDLVVARPQTITPPVVAVGFSYFPNVFEAHLEANFNVSGVLVSRC